MKIGRHQISIRRLIYFTFFAATMFASIITPFPYGFIHPMAFMLVCSIWALWKVNRESKLPEAYLSDEWDTEEE